MQVLRIDSLPDAALAAAEAFYAQWLQRAEALLAEDDLTVVFAPADHTQRGWRLAAVQALARAHAPRRANALAASGEPATAAAVEYLAAAEGVTGQYLVLDDSNSAAMVIGRK
jgi:hypothetical protein